LLPEENILRGSAETVNDESLLRQAEGWRGAEIEFCRGEDFIAASALHALAVVARVKFKTTAELAHVL
jgi:hypothetical protein